MSQEKKKAKKDFHEVDLLVRWSVVVGLVFFLVLAYGIWIIEFDIFRNPKILTDVTLRHGLLFVALFIAVEITHYVNILLAKLINRAYQERFHQIFDTNSYVETRERSFFNEKKYDHVVLLLHGFSYSPQEFDFLIPHLKKHQINYYIPTLPGFGLDDTEILRKIRRQDWYRASLNAYDMLSKIANKVSVVGQSMGGMLAAFIANNRPVHHLIFTSPGFYPNDIFVRHKLIMTMPIVSSIYIFLIPYLPKPLNKKLGYVVDILDADLAANRFHYLTVPVYSVREIFRMQVEAKLANMKCHDLNIVYGQYESTVSIKRLLRGLEAHCVNYQAHCLDNSAHNVMQDLNREDGCKLIIKLLTTEEKVAEDHQPSNN